MNNEEIYYVFPDIHGRYDLLKAALEKLRELSPEGYKAIFLGDYISKGPDSRRVVETLMFPPKDCKFICLMGNHEDMFLKAQVRPEEAFDVQAYLQFIDLGYENLSFDERIKKVDPRFLDWFTNLRIAYSVDLNVFAHAYYDPLMPLEYQSKYECLWDRLGPRDAWDHYGTNLFLTHGHIEVDNGPIVKPHRLMLDCAAFRTGRLVVAIFQKGKRGPHEFLDVVIAQ